MSVDDVRIHRAAMALIGRASLISQVVTQHADDAALLYALRARLTAAGHATLRHLRRFDDRLAAHLDGLAAAGDERWPLLRARLDEPPPGAVFVMATNAIAERHNAELERAFLASAAAPRWRAEVHAGFGWLHRSRLAGIVVELLHSNDAFRKEAGLAACAMHRVDADTVLRESLRRSNPHVRSRAIRGAGEIGAMDVQSACVGAARDADPDCSFWGAWSSVLLGDRGATLQALLAHGADVNGPHRWRALALALQALPVDAVAPVLRGIATDATQTRWLIKAVGIAGDPAYVPWLLKQIADPKVSRLAADAFSLITGADLVIATLEGDPNPEADAGPNEDPDDQNVALDEDDGLYWPHVEAVQRWWTANAQRFAQGTRYFVGAPVTHEHCIEVLKNGYQRQRILAAHYLCLLNPGTPLFNTSAPAWRQQKLLAQM